MMGTHPSHNVFFNDFAWIPTVLGPSGGIRPTRVRDGAEFH